MTLAGALACVALLALPGAAPAHTRSASYSSWKLHDGGASVRVRVALADLTRLGGWQTEPELGRYVGQHVQLQAGGRPCEQATPPSSRRAPIGFAVWAWHVRCPVGELSLESTLLLDVAPGHVHFARVESTDGSSAERVLSAADTRWELGSGMRHASPVGSSLGDYLRVGIRHILSGWDHLAFLIALLLLAGSLGEVATLVTGFTLAHSVTLGLAALRLLSPDAVAVEALIGFSIALVGAENAWLLAGRDRAVPAVTAVGLGALAALAALDVGALPPLVLLGLALFASCHFGLLRRAARPARLRAVVAFAFGLVHGFGFGGFLTDVGLPPGRIVPALLGFNLGVELGQLAVVAMIWPLLRLVDHSPRAGRLTAELGSAAVCGLGLFWFLSRGL